MEAESIANSQPLPRRAVKAVSSAAGVGAGVVGTAMSGVGRGFVSGIELVGAGVEESVGVLGAWVGKGWRLWRQGWMLGWR